MITIALAKRIQALSPTRINDAAALVMAQGLLEDFLIQEKPPRNISWKPEVMVNGEKDWNGNALRFATKEEAEANAKDLMRRWMLVIDTRVVESSDPVNYRWVAGKGLEAIEEN